MFISFFDDAPELVARVAIEHDNLSINEHIKALPVALHLMLDALPNAAPARDDYEGQERDRLALNSIITLAGQAIEFAKLVMSYQVLCASWELKEDLESLANALLRLQEAKRVRIAAAHAEHGEHFGSATGFQMTDYSEDARAIFNHLAA